MISLAVTTKERKKEKKKKRRSKLLVFYVGYILDDKNTLCNGCKLIG
jgi:hypothetical protein